MDLERRKFRRLGRTGLSVSALGLGTVELGLRYGVPRGGEELPTPPPLDDSVALLHAAFAAGVNFVDTAPGYGKAEEILGHALAAWSGPRPVVATKVPCPAAAELEDRAALVDGTLRSVEASLRQLQLPQVELLQIHNATEEVARSTAMEAALQACVDRGLVRFLGASTYGAAAGRACIQAGWCAALQLAYNLLDREEPEALLAEAEAVDVGVIVRSALLKGVLVDDPRPLPPNLRGLAEPVAQLRVVARGQGNSLAQLAVRFTMRPCAASTVIVGVDRRSHLDEHLAAWDTAPLDAETMAALSAIRAQPELLDPRRWGF